MYADSLQARRGEAERSAFEFEMVGPLRPGQRRPVLSLGAMATPRNNNSMLPASLDCRVFVGIPALDGMVARPRRIRRADGSLTRPVPVDASVGPRVQYDDTARLEFVKHIIVRAAQRRERLRILDNVHVVISGGSVRTIPDKGVATRWASLDDLALAIVTGAAGVSRYR